jgi:6-pyruvoyltetrahydropterin/6-carboxytetrahydropterin synthase
MCKFIHGYGVSFKIYFEGELDEKNWVWDFGGMKRAKTLIDGRQPKDWMDYNFDHTMIIAEDDPEVEAFKQMGEAGVAQVRIIPATGAEKFAEFIFNKVNPFVLEETDGRVRVTKVKFMEHGKNAAYYCE